MFQEAYDYYKKAIKMSSDYEMTFNAKIKSAKVVDIQKNTTTEKRVSFFTFPMGS